MWDGRGAEEGEDGRVGGFYAVVGVEEDEGAAKSGCGLYFC